MKYLRYIFHHGGLENGVYLSMCTKYFGKNYIGK